MNEIIVIQFLFFPLLSAAYMNKHSPGGPQNTPATESGGHPFTCPQPALSTVSELSRVCSLLGMSQPDFSFLKTPQVKCFFCKSTSSQFSISCSILNIWTDCWNLRIKLSSLCCLFFKQKNKPLFLSHTLLAIQIPSKLFSLCFSRPWQFAT